MSESAPFHGPDLRPGSKVMVQVGDELVEDTIHSVHYRSAQPEILKHPTGWRKVLRALTPSRWRKPLPVAREYRPAGTEVVMMSQRGRRAELLAEDMKRHLNRILEQH